MRLTVGAGGGGARNQPRAWPSRLQIHLWERLSGVFEEHPGRRPWSACGRTRPAWLCAARPRPGATSSIFGERVRRSVRRCLRRPDQDAETNAREPRASSGPFAASRSRPADATSSPSSPPPCLGFPAVGTYSDVNGDTRPKRRAVSTSAARPAPSAPSSTIRCVAPATP